jgi:hypothetical protein
MKVGDLIEYIPRMNALDHKNLIGTVVDFPVPSHAKEFQKVKVFTTDGVQIWIMQFCKIVSEVPASS